MPVAGVDAFHADGLALALGQLRDAQIAERPARLHLVQPLPDQRDPAAAGATGPAAVQRTDAATQHHAGEIGHGHPFDRRWCVPPDPGTQRTGTDPVLRAMSGKWLGGNGLYSLKSAHSARRKRGSMRTFEAGTLAGAGSFRCEDCGFAVALRERDEVPECPSCGGEAFRRATMFGETASAPMPVSEGHFPRWLVHAREALVADGDYIAFESDDRAHIIPLQDGWTQVGRSLSAQIRIDDPTVSRRHALVYRDADGAKVLDDRSLNGSSTTTAGRHGGARRRRHGSVGRFTLHFISVSHTGAARIGDPVAGALA